MFQGIAKCKIEVLQLNVSKFNARIGFSAFIVMISLAKVRNSLFPILDDGKEIYLHTA